MRVWVRLDLDTQTAVLEDEAGNEQGEVETAWDGAFHLIGPLDVEDE